MKIPASKVPAQVWADKARRRGDLDEVESMLLSSWDDSKQVYRIGKELGMSFALMRRTRCRWMRCCDCHMAVSS